MENHHKALCINILKNGQIYSEFVGDSYADVMNIAFRINIRFCELAEIPNVGDRFGIDPYAPNKYICLKKIEEFDAILITSLA